MESEEDKMMCLIAWGVASSKFVRVGGGNGGGGCNGTEGNCAEFKRLQSLVILSSKNLRKVDARSDADVKVGSVGTDVRERRVLRADHNFLGWSFDVEIRFLK